MLIDLFRYDDNAYYENIFNEFEYMLDTYEGLALGFMYYDV